MGTYNVEYKIKIDTGQSSKALTNLRESVSKNIPNIITNMDLLIKKISKANTALATFQKFSSKNLKITLDKKVFDDIDAVKKKLSSIKNKEITITTKTKESTSTATGTTSAGRRVVNNSGSAPRNGNNRAARGFGGGFRGLYGLSDVLYSAGFPFPNMIGAAAIGMGAYSVVTDFAEFENIMTTVQAILKTTDTDVQTFSDRFDEMSRKIRKVGVDTKFTTTEVAGAAKYLAMAGLGIKDINNSMEPIANLAIITDAPLDRMADIVTNIQTAYGITSDKMPQIADILTSVATGTNTDVLEMGEAMKFAAPMMSMAGISFNEAAGAIGLLANAGLKGTVAGTALRAMMVRLLNPTKKGVEVLKKYNIELYEMDKITGKTRLRSLVDIFSQLRAKNASVQDLNRIFDKIGGNAANNVFAELMKLPEIVSNSVYSGGLAESIATEKQNTLAGKWDKVTSQFSETGMNVFESYAPAVKEGLDLINNFLQTPTAAKIFSDVASGLLFLFKSLINISTWVSNNWGWLEPILISGFLTKRVYSIITSLMSLAGVIRNIAGAASGLSAVIGTVGVGSAVGGGGLLAAIGGIPGVVAAAVAALATLGLSLYTSSVKFNQSIDNIQKKIDELLPGLQKVQDKAAEIESKNFMDKNIGENSLVKNIFSGNGTDIQIGAYAKLQASNLASNIIHDIANLSPSLSITERKNIATSMANKLKWEMLPEGTYRVNNSSPNGTVAFDPSSGKYFKTIKRKDINEGNIVNIESYANAFNSQLSSSQKIVDGIVSVYENMANGSIMLPNRAKEIVQLLTGKNLEFSPLVSYDTQKEITQSAFSYLKKRGYSNDFVKFLFDSLPSNIRNMVPPEELFPNKNVRLEDELPEFSRSGSSGSSGMSGVGTYKGQAPKQVIVNIDNLIGSFTVDYNGPEDKEKIKDLITQTVIEAIQDSEISLMSNSAY